MPLKNVAVIGGGSFGTVIANIIAHNGHHTQLWMRDADQVESLNATRQNAAYMPGLELHEKVVATHDLQAVVKVLTAGVASAFLDRTRAL